MTFTNGYVFLLQIIKSIFDILTLVLQNPDIFPFENNIRDLSLFLHDIITCMHISKKYHENHGGRTILTIRKHAKNLPPPHNFRPKTLDSPDKSQFH